MKHDVGLVITKQYEQATTHWNDLLDVSENISIIFPHLSDRQFRLVQWSQTLDKSKYLPVFLHFSMYSFDEYIDFQHHIISRLPKSFRFPTLEESLLHLKRRVVLFITDGEALFTPQNYSSLHHLQEALMNLPDQLSVVIGFESNLYTTIDQPMQFNKLFQNILYYPLYSESDTNIFIQYLSKKWKLPISHPVRKSIIAFCGGSFWLVKEACRIYRDTHKLDYKAPSIKFRILQLAKAYSAQEQAIISALPSKKKLQADVVFQHLSQLKHFDSAEKFRISSLQREIQKITCPPTTLSTSKNAILLRGVDITQALSQTEYALLWLFLSKPNLTISRDELAKTMWPHDADDKYSEWAIDQAVKRLRDRLVSLQLPPTIIRSVRGVGYEYRV